MVIIVDYRVSTNQDTNEEFISLVLEGEIELIQSKETGRFYATARRTLVATTFDESRAVLMIGQQLPGRIQKVECEPYEYTVPETGEVITLNHSYQYDNAESTTERKVVDEKVTADKSTFSTNGIHELASA